MTLKYFGLRKDAHYYIAITEIHLYVPRCWCKEYTALVNFMEKVGMRQLFCFILGSLFVLALHYHASSKPIKFVPSLHSYNVPEVRFFDLCCFSLIIPSTLTDQG